MSLAVSDNRIRISIGSGRSTDYVDEYVIEDMEGNIIRPWDFPSEWSDKTFQLVEEGGEEE